MFSAESLFVNTTISGQLNIGNLVGRCILKKTRPSSNFKVMDPTPGPHPRNVAQEWCWPTNTLVESKCMLSISNIIRIWFPCIHFHSYKGNAVISTESDIMTLWHHRTVKITELNTSNTKCIITIDELSMASYYRVRPTHTKIWLFSE